MKYNIQVSEPWFTLISLGLKKVEGRKNKGTFIVVFLVVVLYVKTRSTVTF